MAMLTRITSNAPPPGSPKALQRLQNCISFLWPSLQQQTHNARRRTTNGDAIDCFTNELVQRKTQKWEDMRDNLTHSGKSSVNTSFTTGAALLSKAVLNDFEAVRSPDLGLDVRTLSKAQLDNLLQSTLEIKNKIDFLYLIKQCVNWRLLPTEDVLLACLRYLSTLSKLQQIESIIEICRVKKHALLQSHAELTPFQALAQWRCGQSDEALQTLRRGYAHALQQGAVAEDGKRLIRLAFRTIAEETLSQKSEAVLVALLNVARQIHREHADIFVLACIWKQCFISEWFCDQKSAAMLFEEFEELQALVAKKSLSLCASFLRQSNVDAVHRLIEAFLQYKQRDACANCLSVLFDYQHCRQDLRACAEIIRSCSELEMPLCERQNEKFLALFLNQSELSPSKERDKPTAYEYKF